MAAPVDLELKKVKEGLEQAEAFLWKLRGLTRISSESRVLREERGPREMGSGFSQFKGGTGPQAGVEG